MAASPVKFLFGFLFISIICWLLFIFASRLVAWILSRTMGASVEFRVGGWKCVRDVVVKFRKGPVESLSVGEIRLSLRQSLVKLGVGFLSRDPKLQWLISDLEIVFRSSNKGTQKTGSRKSFSSTKSGRGKYFVVANIARFLSVSITELVIRSSQATIEIKELGVDASKDGGSKPALFVKLHLLPIVAHLGVARVSSDQSSSFSGAGYSYGYQAFSTLTEKAPVPFLCEEFYLSCEFGHVRDAGVIIKNVEVTSGDVFLNLNEELFRKRNSPYDASSHADEAHIDSSTLKLPHQKQSPLFAITKSLFPEKVSFCLPRLDVKFEHRGYNLMAENSIMGIQLKSSKFRSVEDVGESTRLDVELDFSEIHLFKEDDISVLEILKLDVISSVYVPLQPTSPIRSEVDVKLGGTRCNLVMGRLKPWMQLWTSKKKKMVPREENPIPEMSQSTELKDVMWTCTLSAPEMTIVLYNLNGLAIYHGCSQSSHVFANNISNTGTSVHMELGELNLLMADEYHECLKESLFGVETNTGSLMHIAKISLDWGKKDVDQIEEVSPKSKLVLSVDITGTGVNLTLKRVESLISIAFCFKALLKSLSSSGNNLVQSRGRSRKSSGKGTRIMNFNLDKCSVVFHSDFSVENTVVADPKRVNYGSQGGRVVMSESADGTPRTAKIMSTSSDECKSLSYSVSLEIFHFSVCVNKEKPSIQIDLERARCLYQEHMEDSSSNTKVALLDMLNAKFVRRFGNLKEIAVCSFFSATHITARWEPDAHIALFELMLHLKLLIHNQNIEERDSGLVQDSSIVRDDEHKKPRSTDVKSEKQKKKKESIFAIDVEMLSISAEAGDGVDAMVQVQSIFSENARIGVLLEGLIFKFNDARIFKSSRMQVSRVPKASSSACNTISEVSTTWDWVVQALDVHVCMPFRVQLRAIDDSVEEMLRALKLITTAKTNILCPRKNESVKPRKASSSKFGCVKFSIKKLTADIEEEPLQGWLDEHYQLLKNEAHELAVRLNFLDEAISGGSQSSGAGETSNPTCIGKMEFKGEKIELQDDLAIQKLREEIHRRSFHSYHQACQRLVTSESSGACKVGFQAGFKPSTSRSSLFSISATELDLSFTKIEGGETGMIEHLQKLDPICLKYNIPFSRLYGSNILLHTKSLVVQIRNYTYPLLATTLGRCEGRVILAQQATCFQPQVTQDVFIGRWRKVSMLRSASGTTPPMKTYLDLPLHFQKGEISYGVGFEPSFADISYAFTVALQRANLSVRNPNALNIQPPKKEKSLPWWDEMRNYVHGKSSLYFSEARWNVLATTDPYEKSEKLQIVSGLMEIHQSDGRVNVSANDFKILLSSLESLLNNCGLKPPSGTPITFIEAPAFSLEVTMDWECESGDPLNHFLFALPNEGVAREFIYDPFRSTSLSLRWNLSLRPSLPSCENQSGSSTLGENTVVLGAAYGSVNNSEDVSVDTPTINVGPHDFAWILKFWNLNYIPPHKLRYFSRWPRFGIPRFARSGNLSLDKVMTEFMFRIDSTPTCLRHMPLDDDDPAKGLTFNMTKLKYELCYSRGKQNYTFDCKRDLLDLVYQGLDLHVPKVYINREDCPSVAKILKLTRKISHSAPIEKGSSDRHCDDGFLLSSDYFTIRKQSRKADPARLLAWQEAGRRNLEMTYVRSEFENGSDSDEHRSDPSDDDGYNVVIADNCQRVFVYGLKLLWTIENRDAVWSWVGGISKAFQPPKPSPSRQYAQRKLVEKEQKKPEMHEHDESNPPFDSQDVCSTSPKPVKEPTGTYSSPLDSTTAEKQSLDTVVKELVLKREGIVDSEEEGTRHFMVNVIEPQFNLHSEDANGRFLLAAVSGRVLARSFHSVLQVGFEMIEHALQSSDVHKFVSQPEMTWNRMEFSVMLEHVQAHVAPTDVDPGAGLQWLPRIRRSSPKVKRTGALLERVFMPCDMYLRYTRHKGGTSDLKVKPLKELAFNSHHIIATMTSRQFQVMLDVLTNLLFARLPKTKCVLLWNTAISGNEPEMNIRPRKSNLSFPSEEAEDVEEEADEVVPDGVEEVELARVNLEQRERMQKLLLDDIRKLSSRNNVTVDLYLDKGGDFWMITGGRAALVQRLKKELGNARKFRKAAATSLRVALQKAAHQRLMEKEKNKSPSYAMRISMQINKVVWGMLVDGKSFAEAEINDMIYDFDRDYKDVGVARFTTKYFVVRNCLPNAKSDMLLSAWNPPSEWGKKVMLGVDAKQGAPKDGNSPIELFQVDIYPLKIHLTETMYKMMWGYFFPEEEQDSQRRQEVWKVSTTAGSKRVKKALSLHEASGSSSHQLKDFEVLKSGACAAPSSPDNSQPSIHAQASKLLSSKENNDEWSNRGLRRTSSFDRTWEETVAESVANDLVLQAHSSSISSSKSGHLGCVDQEESSKNKLKDSKPLRSGRSSHEEKKVGKSQDEKRSRPRKMREFHNIKISQVELLVTYEGSRFAVSDLRLLMDTFHREEFTGTWRRLFSRVKKHIIWGVLKSVTGMQGKKFKDKAHSQREVIAASVAENDLNLSDSDGASAGTSEQLPVAWPKRPTVGAGDGFVTSIRGLFNSQRHKAKAFVLRTMRGEAESELQGEWSESDAEFSPFARQLTITKAKRLIRHHTKKFRSRGQKGTSSQQRESLPSSPRETSPVESDSSSVSSPYEDFHD